jgi:hypothetical protein
VRFDLQRVRFDLRPVHEENIDAWPVAFDTTRQGKVAALDRAAEEKKGHDLEVEAPAELQ